MVISHVSSLWNHLWGGKSVTKTPTVFVTVSHFILPPFYSSMHACMHSRVSSYVNLPSLNSQNLMIRQHIQVQMHMKNITGP